MTLKTIQIATNTVVINKLPPGHPFWNSELTAGFNNVSLSLDELASHIKDGHPFTTQHKDRRTTANFLQSNLLTIDIDRNMRWEEALTSPYIQRNAALLYTTPSHSEELHKFRVVFITEDLICDSNQMRHAYLGLIDRFNSDDSCQDACRLFFGSKDCDLVQLDNVMSSEELKRLIARGKECATKSSSSAEKTIQIRSQVFLDPNQEVKTRRGDYVHLSSLESRTSIHCPMHTDRRASALVVTSKDGINGVHCRKCNTTFWPENLSKKRRAKYDFYRIEDIITENEYSENPHNFYDQDDADVGASLMEPITSSAYVYNDRYLPDLPISDGVTFIRSPKGSGKSELLFRKVKEWKRSGKRILLVGHRRALLISLANRLELDCYFTSSGAQMSFVDPTPHYAICIDSIGKRLDPDYDEYDVVILDESEQVFAHITSDTLIGKRRSCYWKLFHYLRRATTIVAADADLGQITINSVTHAVGGTTPYRFHMNQYSEGCCGVYCYENSDQLLAELLKSIETGGRYYVATNSLFRAETIRQAIQSKFGDRKLVMLVTSKTTKDPRVIEFLANIKTAILDVDVTIASPTIGTGIDISFDNPDPLIDGVFGFFVQRVNTHFDIDQQLSRVRNPRDIRLWVDKAQYYFETEPEAIKAEILTNSDSDDFLTGFTENGRPTLDITYLDIYADVTAMERASMNRLRSNLYQLRKRNGWQLIHVPMNSEMSATGRESIALAKEQIKAENNAAIVRAARIDAIEYERMRDGPGKRKILTDDQEFSMRRYEIEAFYRTDLSQELVELDDGKRYRDKVRAMEIYLTPMEQLVARSLGERKRELLHSDRAYAPKKRQLLHSLLSAAGIADSTHMIKADVEFSKESLGEFAKVAERESSALEELFGIHVRTDVRDKPIEQLSTILEVIGLSKQSTRRCKGARYYKIEESKWNSILEIVERRASTKNKRKTPMLN